MYEIYSQYYMVARGYYNPCKTALHLYTCLLRPIFCVNTQQSCICTKSRKSLHLLLLLFIYYGKYGHPKYYTSKYIQTARKFTHKIVYKYMCRFWYDNILRVNGELCIAHCYMYKYKYTAPVGHILFSRFFFLIRFHLLFFLFSVCAREFWRRPPQMNERYKYRKCC